MRASALSLAPLALVCVAAATLAAADYMYRPPPHLMPHLHGPPHGPPHKHHPYSSGKAPGGGPGKLGGRHPPPHYHPRPHHRPRKPPPSAPLSASSPWKSSPYKTTKDPFRPHGSDPDFGNQAAVLSAIKSSSGTSSLTSLTSSPLSLVSARPSIAVPSTLRTYTNVVSDDLGPIHTIPAPNLSLADRPSHISDALEQQQQALQRQAIQSALNQLTAASATRPAGPTTASPLSLHHATSYQVSEPQTASQEGVAQLYAPDPDPSRPAPRVKPTTDPHSLPSEGRGPHFSIDPHFGAVSSQPGYATAGPTLSPQDLFHLLNGFPLQGLQGLQPLQQDVHPHVHLMHHGLSGDTLTTEHQHLMLQQHHHHQQQQHHLQQQQLQQLQQQHLQQQHLQQQLQAQSLHHLQPANFHPQFQSFDFDEQSYQKSLFQGQQDHEVSEDAPRPSVQRPETAVVEDPSLSASTLTLFTVGPTSSTPARGDIRAHDDDDDDTDEYDDAAGRPSGERHWPSSSTLSLASVTPAPQPATSPDGQDSQDAEAEDVDGQSVIREEADTYAADPSLVTPFRRAPNSVHVPEGKQGRLPYGTRIRPKRIAVE